MRARFWFSLIGGLALWTSGQAGLRNPAVYTGMADASAAVAVSSNLFLVADDESNTLRLYDHRVPGPPLQQFPLDAFLEIEGKSPEADLEGAALLDGRAFWIGSHGRNRSGKERDNRHRFFATDIRLEYGQVRLTPVGKPCKDLLRDLLSDARFDQFQLASASRLAPKTRSALNLEGLAATPEGHLLLGFRNPIPDGKALLIPLLNPNAVIAGARCQFGAPTLLALEGLGIRDLAYYPGGYLIIAGPYDEGGPFHLYRWAGPGTEPARILVNLPEDFHAEAVILYPGRGFQEFQILSDDGRFFKNQKSAARRTFRSLWIREGA